METSHGLPLSPFTYRQDSKPFPDESRFNQKPLEGLNHHQRCSSESFLIEEQPLWLDDLLNDSETVFNKGHRRSASDSYLGEAAAAAFTFTIGDESEFVNAYFGVSNNTPFETKGSSSAHKNNQERGERVSSLAVENSAQNLEGSADKGGSSQPKNAGYKTESKRSKQHNAHRSRVRKLQYIAHLERTLDLLKAEGSEVSAELEFIEQQNIILSMENKALRQRLETVSQEQIIKQWEQGMLEREIGRLQSLFHLQKQQQMQMHHQQQQQQQQTPNQYSKHRRNKSRDLDHQANITSMKNKEANSTKSSVNGLIHV